MQKRIALLFLCLGLSGLPACTASAPAITVAPGTPTTEPGADLPQAASAASSPATTATAASSPTAATPTDSPASQPTTGPRLCTPLKDITLNEMTALVSNPYDPPEPGYDDPHTGVDLAIRMGSSQIATSGHTVQAALPGKVAMIANDRFPFGSLMVVETPLEPAGADWWLPAEIPTPAPTLAPVSALTCPANPNLIVPQTSERSIYTLYAHLQNPPSLAVGDSVACGQEIGAVGASGNALNPHLHFEVRVGPAGMRMPAMAHYDASATAEEMSVYCLWTVSGVFQLVDPLKILSLAQ